MWKQAQHDATIHKVGAEPELYTIELNSTANDVTEQVIKGNIAIIKHTDDGETQIETPKQVQYLMCSSNPQAAMKPQRKPSEIFLLVMKTALPRQKICLIS